jgi:hypothetical protein
VLVSGYFYGDDPEVLKAMAAGVINGFVSKPLPARRSSNDCPGGARAVADRLQGISAPRIMARAP